MIESSNVAQMSRLSIQLSVIFAVIGVGLLYLYIAISSVPDTTKILWASGLSIGVAFTFLVVWTIARDIMKESDRFTKRKSMP